MPVHIGYFQLGISNGTGDGRGIFTFPLMTTVSAFASVTVYGCSDTLRLLWATSWPGELIGYP